MEEKSDRPVGFALLTEVEDFIHLKELDVHPEHGRKGLGTRLMHRIIEWARQEQYPFMTLTTFIHLPWNAPFYEKLGFKALAPEELTPALQELLQSEVAYGLPAENRVAMLRWLAE